MAYKGLHGLPCVPLTFSISFPGLDQYSLSVCEHTKLVFTSGLCSCCSLSPLICMCLTSFHHLVLSSNITSQRGLLTTVTEAASLPFTFTKSPNFIFFVALFIIRNSLITVRNINNFNASLQPFYPNMLNRSLVKARTFLSSHC